MNTFNKQRTQERQIQKLRKQAEEAPNKEIYHHSEDSSDQVETIFEN